MKKYIAIFAVALFAVACAGNQSTKPAEVAADSAVVEEVAPVVADTTVAAPAAEVATEVAPAQ